MKVLFEDAKLSTIEGSAQKMYGTVVLKFSETIQMNIFGCGLVELKDGGVFVSFPQKQYKNQQGETKYAKQIAIYDKDANGQLSNLIRDEAKKVYEELLSSKPKQEEVNVDEIDFDNIKL